MKRSVKFISGVLAIATIFTFTACEQGSTSQGKEILKTNNYMSLKFNIDTAAVNRVATYMGIELDEYDKKNIKENLKHVFGEGDTIAEDLNVLEKLLPVEVRDKAGSEFILIRKIQDRLEMLVDINSKDRNDLFEEAKYRNILGNAETDKPEDIPDAIYREVKIAKITEEMVKSASNSIILEVINDSNIPENFKKDEIMTLERYKEQNPEYFKKPTQEELDAYEIKKQKENEAPNLPGLMNNPLQEEESGEDIEEDKVEQ